MSEKNVIILIRGRQSFEGAPSEPVELVTEGILRQEKDTYVLSYQESEVTGLAGTLTTFQVEPQCVTLLRVGEFNSQMVFEEGRRHMSLYNTPYGELAMGIRTRRMRWSLNEAGGEIDIDYDVEIDHQVTGVHTFQIRVQERQPAKPFASKEKRRVLPC